MPLSILRVIIVLGLHNDVLGPRRPWLPKDFSSLAPLVMRAVYRYSDHRLSRWLTIGVSYRHSMDVQLIQRPCSKNTLHKISTKISGLILQYQNNNNNNNNNNNTQLNELTVSATQYQHHLCTSIVSFMTISSNTP